MTTSDITFVSIGLVITALTLAVWIYLFKQEQNQSKRLNRMKPIGMKYSNEDIANLLEAKIRESSRGFVPPHNLLSTKKGRTRSSPWRSCSQTGSRSAEPSILNA